MRLISHKLCPYVQRAAIVMLEAGVPFERVDIDLGNKPDWFLAISPLGKTPVLEVDGTALFESQVIAEYLYETAAPALHLTDPLARARQRSWIEFGSTLLNAIAGLYNAPDAAAFEAKRAEIRTKFERIEPEIAGPFFEGEQFRLIDGVWATAMRYFDVIEAKLPLGVTDGLPRTSAWRDRIMQRPSVQAAVSEQYPELLMSFLRARNSELSRLLS
ncbi:glutathione S-transferase family protein [Erythrobacter mangrovi]|uniref:Glutathione S-transferase family protein n=1 Tax=Erythrobacter mangrovi TaxID=2739433 RepID=A0A7D4BI74_9SPHN|nr:glutathione S-transferase family protein [Erythrobacter mangrovi]QKG72702.1 glutathione S-transferase family protein [Erythrobacter mangrovi]